MKDWKRAYGAHPARFEEAVNRALREKEVRKMRHGKRKYAILIIAALSLALLAGMAYGAVRSGLIVALRENEIQPEESAQEIIEKDLGSATAGGVTMTVTEAAYTGKTLDVMIEITGSGMTKPPFGALSEVAPQGAQVRNEASQSRLDGDVVTEWHTFVFDEDAPDRMKVAVVAHANDEALLLDFYIDKSKAEETSLISDKTVSGDGTLTVYGVTIIRSPLSEAITVDYTYNLPEPEMDYRIEYLDADGNRLNTVGNNGASEAMLADGTDVLRQTEIINPGAEIAAVRIFDSGSKQRFGSVPVSGN